MANISQINGNLINAATASLAVTASFALAVAGGGSGAAFPFTGSATITGSLVVTGSINATQGITGSLFGTASLATNALTASTAPNASLAIFGNMAGTGFTNPIVTYLPFGTTSVSAAENQRRVASPMAGSLKNLFIRTNNTAPATSVTTFTLRINGVNTDIRVIISGSQVADKYFNITNSASVAVGDEITLQVSTSIANSPQVNQYSFGIFNT